MDKKGLERLWAHIVSLVGKKVDAVEGKGLSTNDYTNEDKEQLATLNTLVGETPVSEQIQEAVEAIEIPQSDWNQNDENAKDYVKGRTHWKTEEIVEVIPESATVTDAYNALDYYAIQEGETYVAILDGVNHTCVAKYYEDDYLGLHYISDGDYADQGMTGTWLIGTGWFILEPEQGAADTKSVSFADGSESHTIKVDKVSVEYVALDEKYIPSTIARTTDVVQPDWNQNDEVAKDYIKNKTHWKEVVADAELLAETTIPSGTTYFAFNTYLGLEIDKTYTVVWDGVSESYVGWIDPSVENSSIGLGDFDGYMVGEPASRFIIWSDPYNKTSSISYIYDTSVDHTIQIFGDKNVYVPLDDEYIPDTIARVADVVQSDWDQNDETATDYVKNRTHWREIAAGDAVVVFEECSTVSEANDMLGYTDIEDDQTYLVTVDGVAYTLRSKHYDGGDVWFDYVGDGIYEESGYTGTWYISCGYMDWGEEGIASIKNVYFTDENDAHTVKLEHIPDVYHSLKSEYLPRVIREFEGNLASLTTKVSDEYRRYLMYQNNERGLASKGFYSDGDIHATGSVYSNDQKLITEEAVQALIAALGLPTPTADDAGKILRVNAEGKYELTEIPNAEEATF